MAKITELPPILDAALDGFETVPVVKDGATGRARLGAMASAAIDGVSRASLNLLSPLDAGWESGTRINTANGNADALAGYESTPFLPVKAGVQYVTNLTGFGAFYDEAQAYVQSAAASPIWVKPILTAPADGFIRMSAQTNGGYARPQMFFQEGAEWPEFVEPFGRILEVGRLFRASGEGFDDDGISPRQVSAWKESANKANPIGRVDGFYLATNGNSVASGNYSYWPPIRVAHGETWTANQSMRFVTFLDAGGRAQSSLGIEAATSQFIVPAGARFAIPTSNKSGVGTFAIEKRADAPTFSPYGWEARDQLPNGEPVRWGLPLGSEMVAAIDEELAGQDWRAASAIPASFGLERLRETRQRLRALRGGTAGLTARLTVSMIGDSWTHDAGRWAGKVARALWSKYHAGDPNEAYGPIGRGWLSFKGAGNGGFPNGAIYWNNFFTGAGTWVSENGTADSPDSGSESSSTAGDHIELASGWDYTADNPTRTLFAEGGSGQIRYRWEATGAWSAIDLAALPAGIQQIDLVGAPVEGTGKLRVEIVAGACKLYGIFERHPTAEGIIANKLGATGTRLQQWAALNAARWQASFAALSPDLVTIMHGTNDQSTARTQAQFKADLLTVIDRVRTARPTADVLLIAPAENQRANSVPMSAYAEAMFQVARDDRDVAFLDLQPAFGAQPADYAFGSTRPWFAADGIHPDPNSGGWAMTDAILAAIGEQAA